MKVNLLKAIECKGIALIADGVKNTTGKVSA
jgi:hypothetical protein